MKANDTAKKISLKPVITGTYKASLNSCGSSVKSTNSVCGWS